MCTKGILGQGLDNFFSDGKQLEAASKFVAAEVTRRMVWYPLQFPPPHVGGYIQFFGHSPCVIGRSSSFAGSSTTCLMRLRSHVQVMWTRPSLVWITAGYAKPFGASGSSSSTSAADHCLPSLDTATFSGLRPLLFVASRVL